MQTDPPSNKKLSKGQLAHSTTQSAQPTAEGPTLPPPPPAHDTREALGSARQPAVQKRHAGMPSTPAVPSAKPTAPGKFSQRDSFGTGKKGLPQASRTPTPSKPAATEPPNPAPVPASAPAAKNECAATRGNSPARAMAKGEPLPVRENVASTLRRRISELNKMRTGSDKAPLARSRAAPLTRNSMASVARVPRTSNVRGPPQSDPITARGAAPPAKHAGATDEAHHQGKILVYVYHNHQDDKIAAFAEASMPNPHYVPTRTPGVRYLEDVVEVWVNMGGRAHGPLLDTLSAEAIEAFNSFAVSERLSADGQVYLNCGEEDGVAARAMFAFIEGDA